MDGRGRFLVDMIIGKRQNSNEITSNERITLESVSKHVDPLPSVPSPCPEIIDSDPVIMAQLLNDLDDGENINMNSMIESQEISVPGPANNSFTETELSLPNSVVCNYVDQPIDSIPSHISSYPSSVINNDTNVDSPGDILLLVGSVQSCASIENEKDFSPDSDNDPNFCPLNYIESSDSSEGDRRPTLEANVLIRSPNIVSPPETSTVTDESETPYLDEVTGMFNLTTTDGVIETLDSQIEPAVKGRPKKGRKRKNPNNLSREDNKINRNSNKTYFDYKNNEKGPRIFNNLPCSCNNKCHEKISNEVRLFQFKKFWELASYDIQNIYIAGKIDQNPTKDKKNKDNKGSNSVKNVKPKHFTRCYKIDDNIIVCKQYFLNTYQISSCRVNTALKKFNSEMPLRCQRGLKQGGINKISEDKKKQVIEYIKRIPTYESHYCREKTDARFLPPDKTLAKIIEIYKEEFKDTNVSDSTFKSIFYSEFNLRTASLQKDTCNFCDKMRALIVNERNAAKKEELKNLHDEHLKKAEEAQKILKADIKIAKERNDTECITFDMEKTLPLPRIPTNVVFYKRQLWLYNEGVYSGKNDQGYCYVWVEGEAGKGAQEVGSVLRRHIKEELPTDVKHLIVWSDSCGGQNRNIKITLMLKTLFEDLPNLEKITMKFLYSGHSFLPNDRHFSTIESALKHQQRLYVPEDYINVMKNAKKKKPLRVKKMEKLDFLSTEKIEKHITNRKVDVNKEKVSWLSARQITFNKNEMYLIHMKESFEEEDETMTVDIKPKNKTPECFAGLLFPLWPDGKTISLPKLKDLASLLPLIPSDCQQFYLNLQSGPGVCDDVDGFCVEELDFDCE